MDRDTPGRHDLAPVIEAVGADMTAIFGSARRDDAAASPPATPAAQRRGRRGWIAGAVAIAAVAIGAGSVFVGQSVVGNPVVARPSALRSPGPRPSAARAARQSDARQVPITAAATGDETEPLPLPSGGAITPASRGPTTASAPTTLDERSTDAAIVSVVSVQPDRPPVSTVVPDRVMVADAAPPPPAACEDDSDGCVAAQLDAADRQLAGVYRDAAASGVRARDLRDYRGEWMRARRQAAYQPRAALRVYDMILADLDTLTDDAAARARLGQR